MLQVQSLTKRYRGVVAVDDVSFELVRGEILGYLGANGAGKSTTVKVLTGLLSPTAGRVFLDSTDSLKNIRELQRRTGYVPEEQQIYGWLSGREHLQLVGRLRGLRRGELSRKIDDLLSLFGLADMGDSRLSAYSKGMRQKIMLCAAILHDPDLLILDEPFSGLDFQAALVFKCLLRNLATRGKMILYCSHILETVEDICDEVIILKQGRIVAHGPVPSLKLAMKKASLAELFADLTQSADADKVAADIAEVVAS